MAFCLCIMYHVLSVGHRLIPHTGKCNVPALPHQLLEHHKAMITYAPISLLCRCNAIYLLLTSSDRSLNWSWSCGVKHWIMSQVPSAGMLNLGHEGPSTYGCHIKFYIIIGSEGAMRRIQWKWLDMEERGSEEGLKRKVQGSAWKKGDVLVHGCKSESLLLALGLNVVIQISETCTSSEGAESACTRQWAEKDFLDENLCLCRLQSYPK